MNTIPTSRVTGKIGGGVEAVDQAARVDTLPVIRVVLAWQRPEDGDHMTYCPIQFLQKLSKDVRPTLGSVESEDFTIDHVEVGHDE